MHKILSLSNVALRGIVESGIVAACAIWGYTIGNNTPLRLLLAIVAPLLVFGFWGAVDFRFAGRHAEPLRLTQELVVTLVATAALYATGHRVLAGLLLLASVVHHAAVYLLGERLLKPPANGPSANYASADPAGSSPTSASMVGTDQVAGPEAGS